jgi:hypothetical protein
MTTEDIAKSLKISWQTAQMKYFSIHLVLTDLGKILRR